MENKLKARKQAEFPLRGETNALIRGGGLGGGGEGKEEALPSHETSVGSPQQSQLRAALVHCRLHI